MSALSAEEFFALSESKDRVAVSLASSGALSAIQSAADAPPFSMSEVQSSALAVGRDILHFIYFSSTMNQFVAPAFSAPYNNPRSARRLLRQYQVARRTQMHTAPPLRRGNCVPGRDGTAKRSLRAFAVATEEHPAAHVTRPGTRCARCAALTGLAVRSRRSTSGCTSTTVGSA
eukprot:164521-Rhodomonas_salina.3